MWSDMKNFVGNPSATNVTSIEATWNHRPKPRSATDAKRKAWPGTTAVSGRAHPRGSPPEVRHEQRSGGELRHGAPHRPSRLPRPPLAPGAQRVAERAHGRGAAGDLPSRGPLRALRAARLRAQGAPQRLAEREYRLLAELDRLLIPVVESQPWSPPAGGAAPGLGAPGARSSWSGPDHAAPRLLTPVPPGSAGRLGAGRVRRPAARRPGQPSGSPPRGRLLLGDCSLSNTLFRLDAGDLAATSSTPRPASSTPSSAAGSAPTT